MPFAREYRPDPGEVGPRFVFRVQNVIYVLLVAIVLNSGPLLAGSPFDQFVTTSSPAVENRGRSPEWLIPDTSYSRSGAKHDRGDLWNSLTPWITTPEDFSVLRSEPTWPLMLVQQVQNGDDEPNIADPGPDLGDYPNSAFTLNKGRVQFEMAPATFRMNNANNSSGYAAPFLFRYGVTDDVEFRVMGTGLTSEISPEQITGFSPVVLDTKIHMWNARMEYLIPAASFEASVQTDLGSKAFNGGYQPSLNINMDFPFTEKTNLEITLGYSGNLTTVDFHELIPGGTAGQVTFDENIYVFQFQWSVEQEITDKLSGFIHGYVNHPIGIDIDGGIVVGAGFFYQISQRMMVFGAANPGLNDTAAPIVMQLGAAYAL